MMGVGRIRFESKVFFSHFVPFRRKEKSKYCKGYSEYWNWIEKRNEDRYNTNRQHGKNYDSKNMMHTIRLLQTAQQILSTGKLNIRVSNREELLDIKAGNKEYDDLLEMADNLIASIENHYQTPQIPIFGVFF